MYAKPVKKMMKAKNGGMMSKPMTKKAASKTSSKKPMY